MVGRPGGILPRPKATPTSSVAEMLKELASFLNRSSSQDNLGRFILVSDSLTDGGFLVHHYITQALKDGHLTYLVSFAQSLVHYHSIATKLGVNLSKQQENGSFVFVDCLTHLLSEADSSSSSTSHSDTKKDETVTSTSLPSQVTFSLSSDLSLHGLYRQVFQSVEKATSGLNRPVCLVIDDLSVLLSLGVKLGQIVSFVSYCRQMLLSPEGTCSGAGYLVAMVHCEGSESDEPEQLLWKHLLHVCHLSLHVQGLSTGYSKDVHGNLRVEWRDPSGHKEGTDDAATISLTKKNAQYKLTDRNVHLFAKGTSSAVL